MLVDPDTLKPLSRRDRLDVGLCQSLPLSQYSGHHSMSTRFVITSSLSPWSWGPNGQSVPFICTVPNPKIQIWILSLKEKNLLIQISFFCIFTFRPRNSKTFTSCLWWMLRCHKASGSPPDINQSFANDQKTLKVDAPGEIKIPTQVEAAQTHCFLKWKLCCLAINVLTQPKKINKSTSSVGFWVL